MALKLDSEEKSLILKKLEYRFKNSNHSILEKLKSDVEEFDDTEVAFLAKKFEYRFKKSNHPILEKFGLKQ